MQSPMPATSRPTRLFSKLWKDSRRYLADTSDQAVNRFEKAVNRSPDDKRAWALLFCAYGRIGEPGFGYSRAEAKLQRLAPASQDLNVYERLFLGYAESETHVAIADGVAKLRSVVKDRPSWGIARAMLAQSLAIGRRYTQSSILHPGDSRIIYSKVPVAGKPFCSRCWPPRPYCRHSSPGERSAN